MRHYNLFKPYARTNVFKNSFWNRYIDKWNSLPEVVVECESVVLKELL